MTDDTSGIDDYVSKLIKGSKESSSAPELVQPAIHMEVPEHRMMIILKAQGLANKSIAKKLGFSTSQTAVRISWST